jgi:transposase-like protein
MIKHLNIKKKCIKRPSVYIIDDTILYNDSLIKINKNDIIESNENNSNCEKMNEENSISEENSIDDKITDEDDIIELNSKSKEYTCKKCNKVFTRKYNLTRHNLKHCKTIGENSNINVLNNYQTNNIETQNIINFNFNLMKSFNEQWDTTSMDNFLKLALMLSNNKYTNTLKSILENDNNLNVIFDKNSEYGLIYNKEDKKFTNMKINEIIELSMEKLNKHLEDFHNEISESLKNVNLNIDPEIIEMVKDKINKKYDIYKNDIEIKNNVNNIISDIFNEKYDHTKKICNKLLVNTENEGY